MCVQQLDVLFDERNTTCESIAFVISFPHEKEKIKIVCNADVLNILFTQSTCHLKIGFAKITKKTNLIGSASALLVNFIHHVCECYSLSLRFG